MILISHDFDGGPLHVMIIDDTEADLPGLEVVLSLERDLRRRLPEAARDDVRDLAEAMALLASTADA